MRRSFSDEHCDCYYPPKTHINRKVQSLSSLSSVNHNNHQPPLTKHIASSVFIIVLQPMMSANNNSGDLPPIKTEPDEHLLAAIFAPPISQQQNNQQPVTQQSMQNITVKQEADASSDGILARSIRINQAAPLLTQPKVFYPDQKSFHHADKKLQPFHNDAHNALAHLFVPGKRIHLSALAELAR
jgi:hypothetical protein